MCKLCRFLVHERIILMIPIQTRPSERSRYHNNSITSDLNGLNLWCPNRIQIQGYFVLRSAVGKTHVLRSRLVMNYTTSYFPLIVLGYPLDSKRSSLPKPDTLCPGACDFPTQGHVVIFGPIICQSRLVPPSSYLRVSALEGVVGCALAFVLQVRSLYVPLQTFHSSGSVSESP